MLLVQKWPLFQLLFFGQRSLENDYYDILERKNAFLAYKKKKFKKSTNWHFSKGGNPGFGPKIVIFPTFFLGDKGKENVFYDFLERKKTFPGYKNKKF